MGKLRIFMNGITSSNPVFILLLGLCPALAVSTSLDNALGMTAAAMFVLIGSNLTVAIIKKAVPAMVRIPTFIVIIATLVTIIHLSLQAYLPSLSQSLGIFVPLIVVNCIILGRAEAFAFKNTVFDSLIDAVGIGLGFGAALFLVSFIRQLLGTGEMSIFSWVLFKAPGLADHPMAIFILPMGAFMVIGCLLALFRYMGVMDPE